MAIFKLRNSDNMPRKIHSGQQYILMEIKVNLKIGAMLLGLNCAKIINVRIC